MRKRTEDGGRTAEEMIRRASGAGVARNMAGVTDEEARKALDGQAVGCLAAVVCGALLALLAAGWVIYVICCRHPFTGSWAQPLGWAGWAFGTAAAAAKIGR